MITAEEARELTSTNQAYIDLMNSIEERILEATKYTKTGTYVPTLQYPKFIRKQVLKTLEDLGYKVELKDSDMFIVWKED